MIPAKEIDGELWIRAADAQIQEAADLRLQMDLRDYFAAKAMQGLCVGNVVSQDMAKAAYAMADAMLKEREK